MARPWGGVDVISQIEIGEIAFESPALLGGAAWADGVVLCVLSYQRTWQSRFQLEGVSGEAGTADITGSLLSKVRGDAVFNPVPIPDLAARDGKQMKDRTGDAFRGKLHGLIVEEFDGQEPPAAVFEAVLAYLNALDVNHCADPSGRRRISLFEDTTPPALRLARLVETAKAGDMGSALLMARASREALERAHERFVALSRAMCARR